MAFRAPLPKFGEDHRAKFPWSDVSVMSHGSVSLISWFFILSSIFSGIFGFGSLTGLDLSPPRVENCLLFILLSFLPRRFLIGEIFESVSGYLTALAYEASLEKLISICFVSFLVVVLATFFKTLLKITAAEFSLLNAFTGDKLLFVFGWNFRVFMSDTFLGV